MSALPVVRSPKPTGGGCGSCGTEGGGSCGSGLEKVYPTTAVRYGAMNYIGEFSYKPGMTFSCGGKVIVQTDRGIELGQQVSLFCNGCTKQVTRDQIKTYIDNSGAEFYRLNSGRILREATADDVNEHEHLNRHIREDMEHAALLAMQMGLEMKIVSVEHLLGGERIILYFQAEGRIDFRDLVRELAHHHRTRIEMRQVGARDEARLVADYEICGRECCCKNFLKKLRPVSMKMAKVQKQTLDPSKVSGRCGRLRCCLRYEHEGYEALMKKLPRGNSRVRTEWGDGVVTDTQILTQLVQVRFDDGREMVVPLEEISAFDLPAPALAPRPEAAEADGPRGRRPAPGDRPASERPSSDRGPDRGKPRRTEEPRRTDEPRRAEEPRQRPPQTPSSPAEPSAPQPRTEPSARPPRESRPSGAPGPRHRGPAGRPPQPPGDRPRPDRGAARGPASESPAAVPPPQEMPRIDGAAPAPEADSPSKPGAEGLSKSAKRRMRRKLQQRGPQDAGGSADASGELGPTDQQSASEGDGGAPPAGE